MIGIAHAMLIPFLCLLSVTVTAAGAGDPPAVEPAGGQLLVFLQGEASPVDRSFHENVLPGLREAADSLGIGLHIVDARRGAPEEVAITPLLVYQNFRGRSIYQGRSNTLERMRNFLRTARLVPQGAGALRRRDALVVDMGRARLAAPVKITPIAGERPPDHDEDRFRERALAALRRGLERFRRVEELELRRTDRSFYLDLYPHRSAAGRLSVSVAVFSQFHCEKPVFEQGGEALQGPWEERWQIFERAGSLLEKEVMRAVADPAGGDGFQPIPREAPARSWEELGYPLPAPAASASRAAVDLPLPLHWRIDEGERGAPPRVQFRFAPPLDSYTGEARSLRGELHLGDGGALEGARGWAAVEARSVTTGEPDLDTIVHGSMVLRAAEHPRARFSFERVASEGKLSYGETTQASLEGIFTLRGRSVPVMVRGQLQPIVDERKAPRLLFSGSFSLRLEKPFGILGPDGPMPASDTLLLQLHFGLAAVKSR
ncbi:MAG: YceI family protein [Planctomycetota bacterium]